MVITTARLIGTLALTLGVVAFGELVLSTPRLYTDTAQLLAGLAAAAVCLAVGRRRGGLPRRWRLLAGSGLLVWSLNRLWWVVQDLAGHLPVRAGVDPPQAFTDLSLFVLPACMLVGLLGAVRTRPLPVPTSPVRDQLALLIDSVLITGSVFALTWSVLPGVPSLGDRTLLYLVVDLVLFTMVVLLLTTRPDSPAGRRPLRLVGSALLSFGVADTVRLLGSGPLWLEGLGHLLGPAFIAMAALSPVRPVPQRPDPELLERDWFRLLLPYGPVVVTGVVLVVRIVAEGSLTPFEAYLGWLGLALVVTRQMLTIIDNTVLFDRVATAQRRLHHQAYHDPLTGLANRALFRERLVHAIDAHQKRGTPVAVLFADLDDFKLINDTFGHAIGDRVLQAVGERMRAGVRSQDLVARLGGDEFAIVLDQGAAPVPAPRRRAPWRRRGDGGVRQRRYVLSAAGVRVSEAAYTSGATEASSSGPSPTASPDPTLGLPVSGLGPLAGASPDPGLGLPASVSPDSGPGSSVSASPVSGLGPLAAASPVSGAGSPVSGSPVSGLGSPLSGSPAVGAVSASTPLSSPTLPAPSPSPDVSAPSPDVSAPSPDVSSDSWAAEAEAVGQRVLAMLREPYVIDGRSVGVGASIGLVTAEPGDRLSADLLLRRADAAMYAVKRRGKGELIRYTGPRDSGPNADLPHLLAGALSGGSPAAAGFDVHYQPIVRLSDGATVAVEALARWTDPVAGPVHPDVFVTMAERTGLVAAIDDFVLDRACADAATLAELYGRPIDVHVNVSAGRLAGQGVEDSVRAALHRYDLEPARLIIEITETLRIPDLPCAAALVERLRSLGVRVALDDFGSGYNALAQLHAIPVDIVKLDSTLTDVDASPDRAGALCRSVLAICAELGITVVAEGLETEDRASAMAALGCPLGQGYLYGAPTPLSGPGQLPSD
ncbi:EAL domain-containing protein [Actinoplanes sp. NEAU-A12]|uniref:EAL domain-containing protein n=1 Tax=Actinoplanes sandaracinus TaxID=3045177 RepID=A0ABT6WP49_9ACTN|nr:EAL domain-containing protein [Actinoplanes sandaracinus]MDI6101520.1 EAL domain-containing protein [Actinoplanes sandaracinus]